MTNTNCAAADELSSLSLHLQGGPSLQYVWTCLHLLQTASRVLRTLACWPLRLTHCKSNMAGAVSVNLSFLHYQSSSLRPAASSNTTVLVTQLNTITPFKNSQFIYSPLLVSTFTLALLVSLTVRNRTSNIWECVSDGHPFACILTFKIPGLLHTKAYYSVITGTSVQTAWAIEVCNNTVGAGSLRG